MLRHRGISFLAAFDFLAAIVSAIVALLFLALVQQKRYTVPPALRTPGIYAVTASWPGVDDDVDLYCRAPGQLGVVYFANRQAGLLHLEADDLGFISDTTGKHPRTRIERIVLRGVEAGEFACSVHAYRMGNPRPVTVTVELHKLIGADSTLVSRRVVLTTEGQEQPAFQFQVSAGGGVYGITRLPIYIAKSGWQTGQAP